MKVASGNVLWKQRKRNWCRTPFTFTVYTLTDKEMSIKTGILNEKFNLIKLFRIVDISVERSFLQRLFGKRAGHRLTAQRCHRARVPSPVGVKRV